MDHSVVLILVFFVVDVVGGISRLISIITVFIFISTNSASSLLLDLVLFCFLDWDQTESQCTIDLYFPMTKGVECLDM